MEKVKPKDEDIFYKAMLARDYRFDGKFFIGVRTTGIYCRPICPAKPKRENTEFFYHREVAEKNGYRACLRCHPESAPYSPAWEGKTDLVKRVLQYIYNVEFDNLSEADLAEKFQVSARHLRRVCCEEIGKTPKQIYFENRLNLAKKLLSETNLKLIDVAYAANFKSIRRFNDAFKIRFKKSPSEIRRTKHIKEKELTITLSYRPPFDFDGLLNSYESHRIGNLEWIKDGKYHRIIKYKNQVGKIIVENNAKKASLVVTIDFPDTRIIYAVVSRVRKMFDLYSDPVLIANALEVTPKLHSLYKKFPGIRLPSGWDPFEIAIGTILGQLVSIKQGQKLLADLIEIAGKNSGIERNGVAIKLFPTPLDIMNSDLTKLGTTKKRKNTLIEFARAVHENKIKLDSAQNVDDFKKCVKEIKGIGEWTADYMALKVLRHADSIPKTDLILKRELSKFSKKVSNENFKLISPWRGYLAAILWRNYVAKLQKESEND